jgi:hypothetical protein
MTLEEKKELARGRVDQLDGMLGEKLDYLVDALLCDYSPGYSGNDCELWTEIKNELQKNEAAYDIMRSMEAKAVRMRRYKVTIRKETNVYGPLLGEEIVVQALSKEHAHELAAEEFAKNHADLNTKQWYIAWDRTSCEG